MMTVAEILAEARAAAEAEIARILAEDELEPVEMCCSMCALDMERHGIMYGFGGPEDCPHGVDGYYINDAFGEIKYGFLNEIEGRIAAGLGLTGDLGEFHDPDSHVAVFVCYESEQFIAYDSRTGEDIPGCACPTMALALEAGRRAEREAAP